MNKVEELYKIFSNINEWLKFAEAKNAILIGFIGTLIGFALSNLSIIPLNLQWSVKYLFIPIEFAALLISLTSFFPYFEVHKIFSRKGKGRMKKNIKTNKVNIFYFNSLKNLTREEIIKYFNIKENEGSDNLEVRICIDIIDQAIINSRITSKKLILFNFSGCTLLAGLVLIIIKWIVIKIF